MSSLAADLAAILAGVRRPGDFFVSGTAKLRAPSLQVEGVGPVALPLLPVQAAQLSGSDSPTMIGVCRYLGKAATTAQASLMVLS